MFRLDDLRALQEDPDDWSEIKVFSRHDALPDTVICNFDQARKATGKDGKGRDQVLAAAFAGDKAWLYEGLRDTQPLSYRAFMGASDPVILLSKETTGLAYAPTVLWTFVESNGQLVQLDLDYDLKAGDSFGRLNEGGGRLVTASIGKKLSVGHFGRFTGYCFPETLPPNIHWRGLVSPTSDWRSLDDYLLSLPSYRTGGAALNASQRLDRLGQPLKSIARYVPALEKELRQKPSGYGDAIAGSLRTLVDTRVGSKGVSEYEVVLIQTPDDDRDIMHDSSGVPLFFHMKDGDWRTFRLLENPVEVIDQFVASSLTNAGKRFNFSDFTVQPPAD